MIELDVYVICLLKSLNPKPTAGYMIGGLWALGGRKGLTDLR